MIPYAIYLHLQLLINIHQILKVRFYTIRKIKALYKTVFVFD